MNIATPSPTGAVVEMPSKLDPLWDRLREQAEAMVRAAPELGGLVISTILSAPSFEVAVGRRVAARLANAEISAHLLGDTFAEAFATDAAIVRAIRADVLAVLDRDPAANRLIEPVLYFKGFHTIQTHRLAHWLWRRGRRDFALFLQSRSSEVFQTDIHPAVPFGEGIFLDPAGGDAWRHRQGIRRPSPENPPWRADRGGRENPRQYRNRPLRPHRRGLGRAAAGAAEYDRRRRAGAGCRPRGLFGALAQHGPAAQPRSLRLVHLRDLIAVI
jgi:hypothetical protein